MAELLADLEHSALAEALRAPDFAVAYRARMGDIQKLYDGAVGTQRFRRAMRMVLCPPLELLPED
jgi:hypothetical protein